jgi:uncharacterized protein (TIGR03435 family)
LAVLCLPELTPSLNAQSETASPAFEVATVKLNQEGGGNGMFSHARPAARHQLHLAATYTNWLPPETGMLFGATGWMELDRFDIDAKAAGNSTFDEDMPMLCALMADRFHLRFHRETRQLTTLVLLVAKNGAKLQPSKDQSQKERINIRANEISGFNIPFGHFVTILGFAVN